MTPAPVYGSGCHARDLDLTPRQQRALRAVVVALRAEAGTLALASALCHVKQGVLSRLCAAKPWASRVTPGTLLKLSAWWGTGVEGMLAGLPRVAPAESAEVRA